MKLTVLLVACMAIAAVQTASIQHDIKGADKFLMEKQKFVFEILLRVDHELLFEEWIKFGGKLIYDKSHFLQYNEWMEHFVGYVKSAALLPRDEFYGAMQRIHLVQQHGLFGFFYYAKDWETFVHNVVWARMNVNPGMFVHAFTLAIIHREDMQGLILPQIYEIFPQSFFAGKYIMAAEKFDWDVFNRQIMLEKEFKSIYEQEYATEIFGKRFYLKDWKIWQWWKLMGLDYDWHVEEKSVLRKNVQALKNDPIWSSIYSNLKMVYLPMDYTRDIEFFNEDSRLSYFTEDVSWNAYWYYLNLDYAATLNGKEFNLDKDRRGEWWIFNLQQILARYHMERLSQGLGEIPTMSWNGFVKTGYNPQLVAYTGNSFSIRNNYWDVESYQNIDVLNKIVSIESRIRDAIASGKYVMKDGTVIDLSLPESIEYIGDLLQGNVDILDIKFFGYWWFYSSMFLVRNKYQDFKIPPGALLNFETMLRDPLSYSMYKYLAEIKCLHKNQLKPYTKEELLYSGVEIEDVKVSKMMTFFDLVDMDLTTLSNEKFVFHDGKLVWDKVLLGRQLRLNHKPFTFDIEVMSDKVQKAVVNVFIGPAFNENGEKLSMITDRENYVQLDKFVYPLVVGKNEIHRSSDDFHTAGDPHTYSELYNYLQLSYEGKYQFYQNVSESHSLFPDRLILPHGWVKGMPMAMFFFVAPYTGEVEQHSSYDSSYLSGIGSGHRFIDNKTFGYPLDRKIEDLYSFLVPNMFVKHVKIYHLEKYTKYWPMKYDNFGSFDYNF